MELHRLAGLGHKVISREKIFTHSGDSDDIGSTLTAFTSAFAPLSRCT
jgi:hypothetical protein